ncbi:hypothetical protein BB561_000843 [Smittium simulii]|uniref:SCP domain-containing protein n=1 Tax=Smittium simulii TaxID=133385 RepID=A0A2T9YXH7_9FUNG|nr:hypothetical protein BB561_000843 [Smittium simulii]
MWTSTRQTGRQGTNIKVDMRNQQDPAKTGNASVNIALGAGFSYGSISENVAYNAANYRTAVRMWMNSPPHRRNILNPAAVYFGGSQIGSYWTTEFASPSDQSGYSAARAQTEVCPDSFPGDIEQQNSNESNDNQDQNNNQEQDNTQDQNSKKDQDNTQDQNSKKDQDNTQDQNIYKQLKSKS